MPGTRPRRVLILEDSDADAELIERRIRGAGLNLELKRVANKDDYLEALESFAPDAIVSDYNLPSYDGLAAMAHAKQKNSRMPFILVSGAVDDALASKMLKFGVTDYILKDRPDRVGPALERALLEAQSKLEGERKLRDAESKFSRMAELSPDAIFLTDNEGKVTYASPAIFKIQGFKPEEMVGTSILDFVSDSFAARAKRVLQKALEGENIKSSEIEVTRKDGTTASVEVSAFPLTSQGNVIGIGSIVRDITERKDIERKLRESEARFRGIAERSSDAIITIDKQGKITYASPSIFRIQGFKPEEIVGTSILNHFQSPMRPMLIAKMHEVLEGKTIEELELEIRRADGSQAFLQINAAPILSNGIVVGAQGIIRDNTEHRRASSARRRLASIVESSYDGIVGSDADGIIVSWNPAAERIFGYSASEVMGKHIRMFKPRPSNGGGASEEKCMEGEHSEHNEFRRVRKDGVEIETAITVSPILDESGKVAGSSAIVRDITERKKIERKLRESEEMIRGVAETSQYAFLVVDLNGNVTFASSAISRIQGYKPEDLIGKPISNLAAEQDESRVQQILRRALNGERIDDFVLEVRKKDGSHTFVEISMFSMSDGQKVTGVGAIARDVSGRKQAEDRIHFQASLLDQVGHSIIVADVAGNVAYWNKESEKLFGWRREDVEGKRADEVLPFLDIKALHVPAESPRETATWKGEIEGARRDGARFPMLVSVLPITNLAGKLLGYSCTSVDISEAKQMERRLHVSEERFRRLAERSFEAVFMLDSGGRYTYVSPAIEKITGHDPSEMLGKVMGEDLPSPSRELFAQELEKVLQGGVMDGFEVEGRGKGGRAYVSEVSAAPIANDGLSVSAVQGTVRDVTERRQAEEDRRLLASIVHASPVGMMSIGLDGIISSWNPAAEAIFGYTNEEMIGAHAATLPLGETNDFPSLVRMLQDGNELVVLQGESRRKDGRVFDISLRAFPIKSSLGKTTGISAVFGDVTDQKLAEKKVRDLQEARERFISAAAHELKTPLVSIKGYSEMASSGSLGKLSEPVEHSLAVITRNADRMLGLIRGLLELQMISSGNLQLTKTLVDLKRLAGESIDNLRPIIENKKLTVEVAVPEVALNVSGDRSRLLEIMDNLLVNAVKFTPERGKIRLALEGQDGQVLVTVSDTGIGISPAAILNIFEPFSKIAESAPRQDQQPYGLYSSGLGLAVTRQLVELHGGRIWAESEGEGKGCTFAFTIPITKA